MNKEFVTDRNFPAWLTLSWAWEHSMDDPAAVKAALARNIRWLREDRGLTQKSLAERAGASLASLKDLESGRTLGNIALIAELGRALDVPCTDLIDPAGSPAFRPDAVQSAARTWPGLDWLKGLMSGSQNSSASSASR